MEVAEMEAILTAERAAGRRDLIKIKCETLAVAELQRCAENLAQDDPAGYHVFDAVRCLHLAMVAAMTAALNGSAGVGALEMPQKVKAIEALNKGTFDFTERTMFFRALLNAVQVPGQMEWSPQEPIVLTPAEEVACDRLDSYRRAIEHPKPTDHCFYRTDIERDCATVAPILLRLMRASHHYGDDANVIAARSVAIIAASGLARLSSPPAAGAGPPAVSSASFISGVRPE